MKNLRNSTSFLFFDMFFHDFKNVMSKKELPSREENNKQFESLKSLSESEINARSLFSLCVCFFYKILPNRHLLEEKNKEYITRLAKREKKKNLIIFFV